MDRKHFWRLIEASRKQGGGDQATQADALYGLLRELSPDEVVRFDTHFRLCMRAANRTDLYAAATIMDGFWVAELSHGFLNA
jgi:hypothetical protein